MPETNEILKIEIKESGAAKAAKNLDKLDVSLKNISNTLTGVQNVDSMTKLVNSLAGLNNVKIPKSVSTGIGNIASALNGIDYQSAGVQGLTDDLTKLGAVDYTNLGSKMSATFGKGIGSIATALNGLEYSSGNIDIFIVDLKKLGSALTGFNQVAGVDFSGIGKVTESLSKLGNIKTIDSKKLEQNMVAIANAVKRLDVELKGIDAARMRELAAATRAVAPAMKNASIGAKDLSKSLRLVNFDILLRWGRKAISMFTGLVKHTMELEQAMQAYNQLMGEFANQEYEFSKVVSERMGINPKEWLDAQSAMMTLATGFGIAADKAAIMSRNATQLGYDIAALRNLPDVTMGLQAVQSGLAGEIEPLRRIGVDLSVAAMQEYAIANGIDKKVSSMTQAEKALIRYNMMIRNTASLQGQWGLELATSQGQMRLFQNQVKMLAQEFGAVLIPILNTVLPILIALTKILRDFVSTLAAAFGNKFEWPEMDYDSSFSVAAGAAGDIDDSMQSGAKAAKEMQKYLAGFDDLNVMQIPKPAAGAAGAGAGGGVGFELPLESYDFFKQINEMSDEWSKRLQPVNDALQWIARNIKDILAVAGAVGAAILAWKISKALLDGLKYLYGLKDLGLKFSLEFVTLGALAFLADLNEFMRYFRDFQKNGPTFQNVVGMLSSFVGMIGDIFIILGKLKIGAALKAVQGIGEIVLSIKDISENGPNWSNVMTLIRGLTDIAFAIAVFTGHIRIAGAVLALQGFVVIIRELAENWDAIKKGDWSGVDKSTLVVGAIEILGGIMIALGVFSKIKSTVDAGKVASQMATVTDTVKTLDTGVSKLSPKLGSLAKNVGMGSVIMIEIAAAAVIFAGAVIVLGKEFEQIGKAWEPVINNGGNVAAGTALGIGIIAATGVAMAALGTGGAGLAVSIGIGTALLVEIGIAAALFSAEIIIVGKLLEQVGIAWQPVLDNGETIATGIALGTGLLVGIGVVTAALGLATVASVGTLPIAIGIGTAVLVELAAAFIIFTESMIAVANELGNNLAPSLEKLNAKLPMLSSDMNSFVSFMEEFAGYVVTYSKSTAISGIGATIDSVIKIFTQDPIKKLAKDVGKVHNHFKDLNSKLNPAISDMEISRDLLSNYVTLLEEIQSLAGGASAINLTNDIFVNMRVFGKNLVSGIASGMQSSQGEISTAMSGLESAIINGFSNVKSGIDSQWIAIKGSILSHISDINTTVNSAMSNLGSTISNSISSSMSGAKKSLQDSTKGLEDEAKKIGQNIGKGVGAGIKQSAPAAAKSSLEITKKIKDDLGIKSPSKVAKDEIGYWYGAGIGEGIPSGIDDYMPDGIDGLEDIDFGIPDTGFGMEFDMPDLVPMTEQFSAMMAGWESIWSESWARMSAQAALQLASIEFNTGSLETQLPTVDYGAISSGMSNEYVGNEALIDAINQSSINRDYMIADLIDAVENQNDGIIEMDGRAMGRWLRAQINDSTARAGKTIVRT